MLRDREPPQKVPYFKWLKAKMEEEENGIKKRKTEFAEKRAR
jgi:hypothetical protein